MNRKPKKQDKPKQLFRVACSWQVCGTMEIEAESIEEAKEIANMEPLPDETDYIDSTFEIDGVRFKRLNGTWSESKC